MDVNVGQTDKTVRIVIGALAGGASLATLAGTAPLPSLAAPVLGVAALILLVTAYTGFCGLYSVLGVDTCPADAR
jgi:hypothetical protein